MGRFVGAGETQAVRAPWWGEAETVTIRKFSWGQTQSLNTAGVETTGSMGQGPAAGSGGAALKPGMRVSVLLDVRNFALMEAGIEAWTLLDESGAVAPLALDSIKRLAPADGDFILKAINDFNPAQTADDRETFPHGA
jgi:hypothetical protein